MVVEPREEDEQTSLKRASALENPISCFMTISSFFVPFYCLVHWVYSSLLIFTPGPYFVILSPHSILSNRSFTFMPFFKSIN